MLMQPSLPLLQANLIALINLIIRLLLGIPVPSGLLVLGMFLPYSRRAEKEADAIGVRLVGRACYGEGCYPSGDC